MSQWTASKDLHKSPRCHKYEGVFVHAGIVIYRLITERWNKLPLLDILWVFLIKFQTDENRQNSKSIHFLCFDKIRKKG